MRSSDLHTKNKVGRKIAPRGGIKACNDGEHYVAQATRQRRVVGKSCSPPNE